MKKILKHIILLLWVVLPLEVMAFSTWDGTSTAAWTKGNGTSSAPYIIETAEHLAYLAQQVNAGNTYSGKYFKMTADIDLCGYQWTPIGTASTPFSGKFDGAHHIVYNLYISNDNMDRVGLFGCIVDGGLRSIGVENCKIEVKDHDNRPNDIFIGSVVAYVKNSGILEYCYATGTTNVYNDAGDECYPYNSHHTITGGVFGRLEDTSVKYCYNAVNMTEGTHRDIGGVIGYAYGSEIEYCYNKGNVRGLYCRAGILGWSGAGLTSVNKIRGCYNMGRITTCQPIGSIPDNNNYNGGILACATYTTISNCFSIGYMDNYAGQSSYAIAASATGSAPRISNFRLNTLNVESNLDRSGSSYPDVFFHGTGTAILLLGSSYYQVDNNSTNNGYVIHQQSIYNTETCGVELTGESEVMLDASVYAHNRAYRGIAWGKGENTSLWTKVSTTDSILNHIGVKNLEHNVKYGYMAYQMTPNGLKYGDDKYFMLMDDKVCEGEMYEFKGKSYPGGRSYIVVDKDTTFFLRLGEIEKPVVTLPEVSVCYEYTWEGQTTKQTTVLKTVVKSVLCGCDSTTYQPVTIKDSVVVTLPEVENCYEYTWEGQTTKKSAKLRKVDVGANGCDSITYQPVIIKDSVVVTLPEVENCYNYEWEGQTTKKDTIFRKVDIGSNGCDSITYQPVIIKDSVVVTLPEVENCYEYTWEGQTTKKSAKLRRVDVGANGCDSITYQPVIIKDSVVVTLPEVENCYEYTWEGQTTKKSAKLRRVDVGANGCDSITYQPVIIKDSVVVTLPEVENCYEYTWEGQTTKKSAKLRRVDVGANGCDSITYQPVIIKDSVVVTLPEVENCYEYTWEGQTTKKSAKLRRVDVGANGCDSITYQPVIIKDSVVVTLPEVENCYEYTWEGQTTKKSAKLRRVDVGANGCDSITYQPVIIKDSVVVTLPEVENCYEYTWEGQTTKKSAKLRRVDMGVNGCDSITYQPVIIKDSVVVHLPDVEACGEYTWHEMTVKESATLRYETVGSNQCDSITYLYVDISYDTSTAVEDTVKYGHNYQKKGFDLPVQREIGEFVFEKTIHTVKGCDSTVVLTLHVIPDRDLPLKPASYVEYKDGRFNWQIENVENFPNVYVEIYDRFGRRVAMYHGYDNNNGWNGYYNGHILPSTDYWYYIRDDIFGSMSGHFTLYYKQGQW